MIAKVGSSTSIQGTLGYLENDPGRVEWKQAHNLASDDRQFVATQMQRTAGMSRTEQPVYHYSVSWDVSDHPTKEQMLRVARQTLQDLGLGEHQALFVAHNDHAYRHLHVMANRVHPVSGKAWDRWMDYRKLEQSLRPLERAFGWKEVPGHHHRLNGQLKPRFGQTLNRTEAAQVKAGETPFFMIVRNRAEEDFRAAGSWGELHQRLAEHGLTIQRGSRGTGGKITNGYEYANLSKVHRDFSMGRLERRLGNFQSLEQLRAGKGLSDVQKTYAQFEQAVRLNKRARASTLKKGIGKTLRGLSTAKQVHRALHSLLAVTTPANPAFRAVQAMGKTMIRQLQQQQFKGRGR